ncbi:MAG: FtsW/RodA/SpoVE family cell cycle protein [Coriobacteriia bacterium]|nr:FtsW/RodA/SpoVE family cell cycle protein [Coriobacteriia bacterium]
MAARKPQNADATQRPEPKPKSKRKAPFVDFAGGPAPRYLLLVGVTILLAIGLLMAFSASSGEAAIREVSQQGQAVADRAGQARSFMALLEGLKFSAFESGYMQLLYIVVGIVIAFVISRIDYHMFIRFAVPVGFVIIAGLVAVFLFPVTMGAHRWIPIGPFTIQPSELAKPVLLVIGASAFTALRSRTAPKGRMAINDWIAPALFIGVVLLLILLEPDMGTTLIICVGLAGAWLLCDLPLRFPVGLGILGAFVMTIRLLLSGGSYGSNRISGFIKTWTSGQTAYQTLQAQYALAGGGLAGVGPGLSRQKYTWLTQAQSDFILAIVGEELGFLGTLTIVLSFVLIAVCGMRIASRAKDRLGRSLAGGAVVLLIFQAILNIFAVTSLIPVTGKPLPFVTVGGTSLITSLSLVGIILSVSRFGGGRPAKAIERPASHLSLIIGGVDAPRTNRKPSSNKNSGPEKGRKPPSKKGPGPDKDKRKKPPRKVAPQKKRRASARGSDKKEDEHEDSLEWRWDSGTHLSGPGPRR